METLFKNCSIVLNLYLSLGEVKKAVDSQESKCCETLCFFEAMLPPKNI